MIIPFVRTLHQLSPPEHFNSGLITDNGRYRMLLAELENAGLGLYIAHLLKTSEVRLDLPEWFQDRLKQLQLGGYMQNMLIRKETEALLRKLEDRGIPVIPMKGTVLAERYFGHFSARGTSDIDLLVQPEHLQAAISCVREAGYNCPAADSPVHYHTEWMKDEPGLPEPLTVELHWSLVSDDSAQMDLNEAWAQTESLPGYRNARVWLPTYTFYALCLHGASHQMDSSKYVIDLLHMLTQHRGQVDLQEVLRLARRDHTVGRVKAALSILYQLVPEMAELQSLPIKPSIRYWNPSFIKHIGDAHESRFKLRRWLFNLYMLDSGRYRLLQLKQLVLPSKELAAYSVDDSDTRRSTAGLYLRLYRQRLRKLLGG